jgi:hypothetical protein
MPSRAVVKLVAAVRARDLDSLLKLRYSQLASTLGITQALLQIAPPGRVRTT